MFEKKIKIWEKMDSDKKPNILRMIFLSVPILFVWWIIVFLFLVFISSEDDVIFGSIFILILSIPVYFFLALKYASKFSIPIDSKEKATGNSSVNTHGFKEKLLKTITEKKKFIIDLVDSDKKSDIWKIIFIGIPILFVWWIFVFLFLGFISRNGSIFILILSIPVYFFLALKYASNLGATIDSKDNIYTIDLNKKPDIWKIIFTGIPTLFAWWVMVWFVLMFILRNDVVSKYGSIFILILSIPIYFILAFKYASKLGTTIDSKGDIHTMDSGKNLNILNNLQKKKPPIIRKSILIPLCILLVLLAWFIFFRLTSTEQTMEDDFSHLVRIDPLPQTKQFIQQEKFAEAYNYLSYFMDYDYVNQDPEAIQIYKEIQDTRDQWSYKLKKINYGFWYGESDEPEGAAGAMVSDFLVIGDIRDLGHEGQNYIDEKDVDEVTIALSALGIAATASAFFTDGATETAKPVISTLKMMSKAHKIPKWLGKSLIESAKVAKGTKNIDNVFGLFSEIKELYKTAGARSTFDLIGKSKDLDDFRSLAKFGKTFGTRTSTLIKIAGDDIITVYERLGNIPPKTFLEAASFGRDGVTALKKHGVEKFQKFLDYKAFAEGAELRNGHLAGKVHPITGIPYDIKGYPDFSGVAKDTVQIYQRPSRPPLVSSLATHRPSKPPLVPS